MPNENSLLAELEQMKPEFREMILQWQDKLSERGYEDFGHLPTGLELRRKLRERERRRNVCP